MASEPWLELAFDQGPQPGRIDADGHMDFFERELLKAVVAEQIVAVLHAATLEHIDTASAPETLTAAAAPTPLETAASLKLALGAGVSVDAAGVVRARRAGVVLYRPAQLLDVVDRHVHQGPVDLRSGHLDMQGSLTIKGDIERLLQARATGDIEVLGSVSGGSLRAGGAVRVSGSVRGGDDARIVAGTDITLRSCENADVTAGRMLAVREVVSSRVCAEEVRISGRMRGGTAVAETRVQVAEAGTPTGLTTLLEAGQPCEMPELEQVQRSVLMQKLRRMAERGGVRDPFGSRGDARGKGGKLGRIDAALSSEQQVEVVARAARRQQLQRSARLEVGLAHPGVELRIGEARLLLEQSVRALRYSRDAETGSLRAERISK